MATLAARPQLMGGHPVRAPVVARVTEQAAPVVSPLAVVAVVAKPDVKLIGVCTAPAATARKAAETVAELTAVVEAAEATLDGAATKQEPAREEASWNSDVDNRVHKAAWVAAAVDSGVFSGRADGGSDQEAPPAGRGGGGGMSAGTPTIPLVRKKTPPEPAAPHGVETNSGCACASARA
ncbi:hypothetical protein MMPV_001571 [Pyropia vietnamensis]